MIAKSLGWGDSESDSGSTRNRTGGGIGSCSATFERHEARSIGPSGSSVIPSVERTTQDLPRMSYWFPSPFQSSASAVRGVAWL